MIARVVAHRGGTSDDADPIYQRTCRDVLGLDRASCGGAATVPSPDPIEADLASACELVETAVQNCG
jgi:hypothetical protein